MEADLTTLGKIIGGGLPVAAYGGSATIMDRVAPLGPVYQAGTLAGNPLAMRAGIATLDQLSAPGLYERIEKLAATLVTGIREALRTEKIPGHLNAIGSLATLFSPRVPSTIILTQKVRHEALHQYCNMPNAAYSLLRSLKLLYLRRSQRIRYRSCRESSQESLDKSLRLKRNGPCPKSKSTVMESTEIIHWFARVQTISILANLWQSPPRWSSRPHRRGSVNAQAIDVWATIARTSVCMRFAAAHLLGTVTTLDKEKLLLREISNELSAT
jgi:hypothetical protein